MEVGIIGYRRAKRIFYRGQAIVFRGQFIGGDEEENQSPIQDRHGTGRILRWCLCHARLRRTTPKGRICVELRQVLCNGKEIQQSATGRHRHTTRMDIGQVFIWHFRRTISVRPGKEHVALH